MTISRGRRPVADVPRLKITGPADLILAVPYLLGFHPARSLVLVGLFDGRVVVTARVDLPDVADAVHGSAVLAGTLGAMAEGGADHFVGMVFDDRASASDAAIVRGELPWDELVEAVEQAVAELEAQLDDVVLVGDDRWWSYLCDEPTCCPPEGSPLDDGGSVVPATAAYAGMVALPDRAALAELLAPEPDEVRSALLPELAETEAALRADGSALPGLLRALLAAARRATSAGDGPDGIDGADVPVELSHDQLVRFGAALRLIDVRDSLWLVVDDRSVDGRALWRALGRQLPDPYAAAPMFLHGWASWRAGEGSLANVAVDRTLASDPGYTAGDLLLAALTGGVDPRRMPPLGLTAELLGAAPAAAGRRHR